MFIGIEFLTQQNIVRVPPDHIESLLLTIKQFLTQTQVSAQTFFSFLGKLSAAADLVVLGRLHLQPLQMCLLSVWKLHILPLNHQVPITSMIRFHLKWWMDTYHFVQGMFSHPPDPNAFLFHGCQPLWMGSSSQNDEIILSWSLDGRPVPAPNQHSRNNGH